VANALTFSREEKFDHILFNCPVHFSYERQLNLKESLAVRFIDENLEHVLNAIGVCQIWTVMPVPKAYGSLEAIMEHSITRVRERFQISFCAVSDSKFGVSSQSIARNRVSKTSLLAFPSAEGLERFIKNNEITEIAVSVINVRLRNA
jgi:hypothetical protein